MTEPEAATHIDSSGIGRITEVPLREVWPHEALDFTRWLEANPEVLGDLLGLQLDNIEREQSAGTFNVDLVAEDADGAAVVIENQLEKSDHDHLGKLITYLSMREAKTAVWVVAEARPEHLRAVGWLNELSGASFYLVEVSAVRIGESEPAPLMRLITGPSEVARQVGGDKKQMAEREQIRQRFWASLLDRISGLGGGLSEWTSRTPTKHSWMGASSGVSGLMFVFVIRKHDTQAELYIDTGDGDRNEEIFEALATDRIELDGEVGAELDWDRLESKRACRIRVVVPEGGYRDPEDQWAGIQDGMIEAMKKLKAALLPRIKQMP